MKNGNSAFIAATGIALFFLLRKNNFKGLKSLDNSPSVYQCANRLKEFFELSNLRDIQSEYYDLVDNGLNPEDAFRILVSGVI